MRLRFVNILAIPSANPDRSLARGKTPIEREPTDEGGTEEVLMWHGIVEIFSLEEPRFNSVGQTRTNACSAILIDTSMLCSSECWDKMNPAQVAVTVEVVCVATESLDSL